MIGKLRSSLNFQIMKKQSLKFRRSGSFDEIPRRLFEQVKVRDFDIDKVYEYGPAICANPFQLLYALVDGNGEVHGVVWASVNFISDAVFINLISVDKEFQDGTIVPRTAELVRSLRNDMGLSRIMSLTTRAKAGKRLGWKPTGLQLLELEE